jgi:hypothetical protein
VTVIKAASKKVATSLPPIVEPSFVETDPNIKVLYGRWSPFEHVRGTWRSPPLYSLRNHAPKNLNSVQKSYKFRTILTTKQTVKHAL